MPKSDDATRVLAIARKIAPLLAGNPPQIQGAVLAELLSLWLAGHHPDIREEVLQLHIMHMRPLIEPNAAAIRAGNH